MAGQFCTNPRSGKSKVRYSKRQQAVAHAAKTTACTDRTISAYKCCWCKGWHCTSRETEKVEQPPSASKLRRQLDNYGREIAAAQRRVQKADAELARQQAKAEEIRQAEQDHAEELAYINREINRLQRV